VSPGKKNSGPKNALKSLGPSDSRANTQLANIVELPDSVEIGGVSLFNAAEIVSNRVTADRGCAGASGLI
jgi:hypothetical protein